MQRLLEPLTRLPFTGPAPPLPRGLDDAAEAWARLPPRARLAARGALSVVVVLACTGGLLRGPYGRAVPVLVTTTQVAAGAVIGAGDVTDAHRPAELVPPDALRDRALLSSAELVAVGVLPAGTVVTPRHLASALGTVDGTASVPVPAELLPPLPVGTRLDVSVPTHDDTAALAAHGAVVVADDGVWRWLQVQRDDVAALAVGIRNASLVVAVLPPPRSDAP